MIPVKVKTYEDVISEALIYTAESTLTNKNPTPERYFDLKFNELEAQLSQGTRFRGWINERLCCCCSSEKDLIKSEIYDLTFQNKNKRIDTFKRLFKQRGISNQFTRIENAANQKIQPQEQSYLERFILREEIQLNKRIIIESENLNNLKKEAKKYKKENNMIPLHLENDISSQESTVRELRKITYLPKENREVVEEQFEELPKKPQSNALRSEEVVNVEAQTRLTKTVVIRYNVDREIIPNTNGRYISISSHTHYYLILRKGLNKATPQEIQTHSKSILPNTLDEKKDFGMVKYALLKGPELVAKGIAFKTKDPTTTQDLYIDKRSFCELLQKLSANKDINFHQILNLLNEFLNLEDGIHHIGDLSHAMLNSMTNPSTFNRNPDLTLRRYE